MDKNELRENMLIIQQAIQTNVEISFKFYGYNHKNELELVSVEEEVSPYYIVANSGKYYMFTCKEVAVDNETFRNMSIWRIDLMADVDIPGMNEKLSLPGIPRLKMKDIENIPMKWSEDFQLSHLNMSYDKPVLITIKISSPKKEGNPTKWVRADYAFLHDWFGDTFKYIRTEKEAPYDDIVQVI